MLNGFQRGEMKEFGWTPEAREHKRATEVPTCGVTVVVYTTYNGQRQYRATWHVRGETVAAVIEELSAILGKPTNPQFRHARAAARRG